MTEELSVKNRGEVNIAAISVDHERIRAVVSEKGELIWRLTHCLRTKHACRTNWCAFGILTILLAWNVHSRGEQGRRRGTAGGADGFD